MVNMAISKCTVFNSNNYHFGYQNNTSPIVSISNQTEVTFYKIVDFVSHFTYLYPLIKLVLTQNTGV